MIESVKIGGLTYDVEEVEGLANRELEPNLGGQIDYRSLVISVEKSFAKQLQNQMFVHELTHGILVEAGYLEHEEEQADRISRVLYQVLKDNDFSFLRKG